MCCPSPNFGLLFSLIIYQQIYHFHPTPFGSAPRRPPRYATGELGVICAKMVANREDSMTWLNSLPDEDDLVQDRTLRHMTREWENYEQRSLRL